MTNTVNAPQPRQGDAYATMFMPHSVYTPQCLCHDVYVTVGCIDATQRRIAKREEPADSDKLIAAGTSSQGDSCCFNYRLRKWPLTISANAVILYNSTVFIMTLSLTLKLLTETTHQNY